ARRGARGGSLGADRAVGVRRHCQRGAGPWPGAPSGGRDRRRPARADRRAGRVVRRAAMILRRTAAYLWPYRWQLGVALLQVAVLSTLELLKPWPLQLVIDGVLGGRPIGWGTLKGLSAGALLTVAVVGLVLIYVLLGAMAVWNNY